MQTLQRNAAEFISYLECNALLIAEMLAQKIITSNKRAELFSKPIHERNDIVFTFLMHTSRGKVEKFRKILENDEQDHVANLLRF